MNNRSKNIDAPATKVVGAFLFFVMSLVAVLTLTGCGSQMPEQQPSGALSDLSIKTKSGTYQFNVELALDERSQAKGLMFRRSMPPDHGMLFIYDPARMIRMWMKNTILSLDMLFVKRDGTIAKIFERTEPFSERVLSSDQPVYGVLELNAGSVERFGIRSGDQMIHPLLQAQ